MYKLSEIAASMQAEVSGDLNASGDFILLTDSRTLTIPEKTIFFALKTKFNDGHKYIPELVSKGVKCFVCSQDISLPEGCIVLKVKDTLTALQNLAAFHRTHFQLPVIGITGSNGKTIVKEWLLQMLGNRFRTCASPKSYNSQIGVPISVWQLNKTYELALFEAGISAAGEMEKLSAIIQPDLGILTHLGTAHNEGFASPAEKLKEKLLLFEHCKVVLMAYQPEIAGKLKAKTLGFAYNENKADLNITHTEKTEWQTNIKGVYQGKPIAFTIPFTDDASIENACLCCLALLYLESFDPELFSGLKPVSMRMELKKGINRCIVVNDSYSNDLNALSTALSFLKQQALHKKLTVILSDIEQSGLPAPLLYAQIKNLLTEKNIARIIGIGPQYMEQRAFFETGFECSFYPDTEAFLRDFYRIKFQDESILIKGARRFEFENIVKKLELITHGTVLEINLSAALKNLNVLKSRLPEGTGIMAMVKAFAYGSGSYEIAKLLCDKVQYLAVAYTDEGVALRESGIETPIMVMNADADNADLLFEYKLEPVIYSTDQLMEMLHRSGMHALNIHIEIDTGMHRLGFQPEETEALCLVLKRMPNVRVASLFSHLSASDEAIHDGYTKQQFDVFLKTAKNIEQQTGYSTIKHISNTAAAIRFPQDGMQMVRLGIGLYGIDTSGMLGHELEPVFTLKSHISQIKRIKPNESIGYSRKAIENKERKIAVLELGYADGLNRALSNGNGGFYINGKYAPITGNICMDMCMIDVSDIDCRSGDEAILFGKAYDIKSLAEKLHTIPYEVLTSISQRVKRVYVSE